MGLVDAMKNPNHTLKVILNISGEVETHCTSPICPEHTMCGDQYVEDDGETIVIGDAPDNARVTCEDCKKVVEHCKHLLRLR